MDGQRVLAIYIVRVPYILIFKATAAYELTHDARWRYFFVADGQEEVDELQQAMGLGIFGTILRNA